MRTKLSEKYQAEREDICNQLIDILQLKPDNSFLMCELDSDIEKQQRIMALKDIIPKYFACSEISSFKKDVDCKRPYLNIIRGILRKQGYIFSSSRSHTIDDVGNIIGTQQYFIFRPTK